MSWHVGLALPDMRIPVLITVAGDSTWLSVTQTVGSTKMAWVCINPYHKTQSSRTTQQFGQLRTQAAAIWGIRPDWRKVMSNCKTHIAKGPSPGFAVKQVQYFHHWVQTRGLGISPLGKL